MISETYGEVRSKGGPREREAWFRTSVGRGGRSGWLLVASSLLFVGSGCREDEQVLSAPSVRVAQRGSSAWEVSTLTGDPFASHHSVMASDGEGATYALRDLGGSLLWGRFEGGKWTSEPLLDAEGTALATDAEESTDQLEAGVMRIAPDGSVGALLKTVNGEVLLLQQAGGDASSSWYRFNLPSAAGRCFDLAATPDSRFVALYGNDNGSTVLATLDGEGGMTTEVVYDFPVCGSVATSSSGTLGVLLWLIEEGGAGMTARLMERDSGQSSFTTTDIATNGYVCGSECDSETYNVPPLAYRGDNVPVSMILDITGALNMTYRGTDGLFVFQVMANAGQLFQYTRPYVSAGGTVAVGIVLDGNSIGSVRSSSTEPFATAKYASGINAGAPRLTFIGESIFMAYWDDSGLWGITQQAGGTAAVESVDAEGGLGYLYGYLLSATSDLAPLVFYSEAHVETE